MKPTPLLIALFLASAVTAGACASARQAAPSITNNQEAGVDEGDIVKVSGDFFVILRRGRLFTVRLRDAEGSEEQLRRNPTLLAAGRSDVAPAGYTQASWYDELLVHDDAVVVVGYSYGLRATELGLFRVLADGSLRHDGHLFLRSNDYYSSRNYASRLLDGKLVFYMPEYFYKTSLDELRGPLLSHWVKENETTPWQPMLSRLEVFPTGEGPKALHSVIECRLDQSPVSCSARGVVGPASRTFYVTRRAVYVWAAGHTDVAGAVYRLPLGEGPTTSALVQGMPVDQFSFKETEDDELFVVATSHGGGDAMFYPEWAAGRLALYRLPRSAFAETPRPVPAELVTPLPELAGGTYGLQNRFVGRHLLVGAAHGSEELLWVPLEAPREARRLGLEHSVERIEALGSHALLVGKRGSDLLLTTLELSKSPRARATITRRRASQGETRSHGFFFRPDPQGAGGLLGLPVRREASSFWHLFRDSAEVLFVRVDPELGLFPVGSLEAQNANREDACRVSCVDWYGNARPIFYENRVFALLGYELVEADVVTGRVRERRRVDFLEPAPAMASALLRR